MSYESITQALEANGWSPEYLTPFGRAYCGDSLDALAIMPDDSINLVMTSPPFALQRVKDYGNVAQSDYARWLSVFGELVHKKLRKDGSFVLDLGGSYIKGVPTRSLHNYRVLIDFCDRLGFHLAQEFFWHNPSKLPSPIEWVNKRKIRVKDSVDTIWWLGKTEWPKANVRNVLSSYSDSMKRLLAKPPSKHLIQDRPSGHKIGKAFAINNGGSIPSNLLQIANTDSNGQYLSRCKKAGVKPHPARFPFRLPEFFIRFLTDPGDVVVDIFAGSNTTGFASETLDRKWLSFDESREYVMASSYRFQEQGTRGLDKQ